MKTAKIKMTVCTVALLGLLAGTTSQAADPADTSKDYAAGQAPGTMPERCNKATSLIGMDVRNQNDEHLGHIKDIVLDFKSGRVSYLVMTTAPKDMPEFNEKLLAVPVNVFTVSPDQKHLILNADKTRVEAAAGFDSRNWPALENPTHGTEQFWNNAGDMTPSTVSPADHQPGQPGEPGTMQNK